MVVPIEFKGVDFPLTYCIVRSWASHFPSLGHFLHLLKSSKILIVWLFGLWIPIPKKALISSVVNLRGSHWTKINFLLLLFHFHLLIIVFFWILHKKMISLIHCNFGTSRSQLSKNSLLSVYFVPRHCAGNAKKRQKAVRAFKTHHLIGYTTGKQSYIDKLYPGWIGINWKEGRHWNWGVGKRFPVDDFDWDLKEALEPRRGDVEGKPSRHVGQTKKIHGAERWSTLFVEQLGD